MALIIGAANLSMAEHDPSVMRGRRYGPAHRQTSPSGGSTHPLRRPLSR